MKDIHVDSQFPGGNITVESIVGDTVRLRQDLRDTPRSWFYWCFRIRGAAGRTLRFEFTDGHVFGTMGPSFSPDGVNWRWLGRDAVDGDAFTFTLPAGRDEACFAFCPPYTQRNLDSYLAFRPFLRREVLAISEGGREVELLTAHSESGRLSVLVIARHHACEAPANLVLEGILDRWQKSDWLREQVDVRAVPFVDKDGVENGDQGKCRAPHDHWEDYTDSPIYAPVRELMRRPRSWRGELALVLDLHCPTLRDERILIAEPPEPWAEHTRSFARLLSEGQTGPLIFFQEDLIPFGSAWNTGNNECTLHFLRSGLAQAGLVLEIPYADVRGATVDADSLRALGSDVGRSIERYLQQLRRF